MTILYTDPIFLLHETGMHPENPNRLRSIDKRLKDAGLIERCSAGTFEPISPVTVQQLHSARIVQQARELSEQGGGHIDGDTIVSRDSYDAALSAAGAGIAAVDAILAGRDKNALCLVRPPGHHATPYRSMGFCLFNNIALAAHHARKTHNLNRILIIDWDVHHGNGTQDIFYEDDQIFFFSIHRYGNLFYPGTGAADETGNGPGLGFTRNVPITFGTPRDEFRAKFESALKETVEKFKPELVMISAGFDAHKLDPVGSLGLETEDFAWLTTDLLDIADTHADGRVVSFLEGGYHLDALAESVHVHLEELLKRSV